MIMTLRLLAPVPADAGGSVAARSVVAAAETTAERRRRGATIDVGDEIEARAIAAFDDDLDDATPAGRAIFEARALLLVEEAIDAALKPV